MTYEEIIKKLESNHFYAATEVESSKKGDTVIGLRIECPALIIMEDKKKRLEEVLEGCGVKIECMRNQGYLLIKKVS